MADADTKMKECAGNSDNTEAKLSDTAELLNWLMGAVDSDDVDAVCEVVTKRPELIGLPDEHCGVVFGGHSFQCCPTPALMACMEGNLPMLKMFLEVGRQHVLESADEDGANIAHYAASGGSVPILDLILDRWPSMVDVLDSNSSNLAFYAAQCGSVDVLRWLLEHRPQQLQATSENGSNIAHWAAYGDAPQVLQWISNSTLGDPLLQASSQMGNIAVIGASQGNLRVLDWVNRNKFDMLSAAARACVFAAAGAGELGTLHWLHYSGFSENIQMAQDPAGGAAHMAYLHGHHEVVAWFAANYPTDFTRRVGLRPVAG